MKIISHETITPSSPTPPHLRTHVLSLNDNAFPHIPLQFVFFYSTSINGADINILKNSLSQCLTLYYPFSGRFLRPSVGEIDCNDEGVHFLEVVHDHSRLEDFIRNDESLKQLVPSFSFASPNLLEVQLNHFNGGGMAIGLSILHKIADGFTIMTFVNQWAKVARGESPFKPNFFTSSTSYNNNVDVTDHVEFKRTSEGKHVIRSFVFPNSKLNELKKKVISMEIEPMSPAPTRVELLTSLVFTSMVDAATKISGVFKPSMLTFIVNMRDKVLKNNSEKAVGNIIWNVTIRMDDDDGNEMKLSEVVSKLRKGKTETETEQGRDLQAISENIRNIFSNVGDDPGRRAYMSSSLCRFPVYEVDFGWGKPVKVKSVVNGSMGRFIFLMDTPTRDGIEVTVQLPEEEMEIFQQNKEFMAYVGA